MLGIPTTTSISTGLRTIIPIPSTTITGIDMVAIGTSEEIAIAIGIMTITNTLSYGKN